MRIHAAVARALEPRADDPRVLTELARHACIALPVDRTVDAVGYARRAGDHAVAAADHGAAVEQYSLALEALELVDAPDEQLRLLLTIRLGEGLVLSGERRGRDMLLDAARWARRCGDSAALAEAICGIVPVPGGATTIMDHDAPFRALAEHALEVLPQTEAAWRVRVLALLGRQIAQGGNDPRSGSAMVRQAVDDARTLGDPVTLGRALLAFRFCGGPFDIAERIVCGHELVALGDVTGLEVFAGVGRQQLWWCAREMGDIEAMDRWYDEATEHVKGRDVEQLSHEAAVALLHGDLDQASALSDELAEVEHLMRLDDMYVLVLRFVIAECRGDVPDVERQRRRASTLHGRMGANARALLARSCAHRADCGGARAARRARQAGFAEYSMCHEWPMAMGWWAETAAITDDAASAAELLDLMQPLAGRLADAGMVVTDTVDRVLALLALTVGDVEDATNAARRAVTASRRRSMPIMLGRELVVLAAARRRGGGGREVVDDLVSEAVTIADRTGARIIHHDLVRFHLDDAAVTASEPSHDELTMREQRRARAPRDGGRQPPDRDRARHLAGDRSQAPRARVREAARLDPNRGGRPVPSGSRRAHRLTFAGHR